MCNFAVVSLGLFYTHASFCLSIKSSFLQESFFPLLFYSFQCSIGLTSGNEKGDTRKHCPKILHVLFCSYFRSENYSSIQGSLPIGV